MQGYVRNIDGPEAPEEETEEFEGLRTESYDDQDFLTHHLEVAQIGSIHERPELHKG